MTTSLFHDITMIGSGVSITSSMMLWLGTNASAIGVIWTIFMGLVTTIFFVLNYKVNKRRLELEVMKAEAKKC